MTTSKKPPAKPAAKKPEAPAKPTLTKAQLTKAAKLRGEGATWNAMREATGAKLGSSAWSRGWEREGIAHRPGEAKPKASA